MRAGSRDELLASLAKITFSLSPPFLLLLPLIILLFLLLLILLLRLVLQKEAATFSYTPFSLTDQWPLCRHGYAQISFTNDCNDCLIFLIIYLSNHHLHKIVCRLNKNSEGKR